MFIHSQDDRSQQTTPCVKLMMSTCWPLSLRKICLESQLLHVCLSYSIVA